MTGEGLETSDTGAGSEDDDSGTKVDTEAFVRHAFTILYKGVAIQDMYVRHGVSTARRR